MTRRNPRSGARKLGASRQRPCRSSRSRTCRSACFRRPTAARRAAGWRSATASSICRPRRPRGCSPAAAEAAAEAAAAHTLNRCSRSAPGRAAALRRRLSALLDANGPPRDDRRWPAAAAPGRGLHDALPAAIGDYTDFSPASITRPTSAGCSARTIRCCPTTNTCRSAYHGRASSVRVSGSAVRRPSGQRKPPERRRAGLRPCRNARLRAGDWASGSAPATRRASRSRSRRRATQIAGVCLLNDWSARDIQAWEYQPLGPFLAKSFAHHDLPLDGHRRSAGAVPRAGAAAAPEGDPPPLPYLDDRGRSGQRRACDIGSRCPC